MSKHAAANKVVVVDGPPAIGKTTFGRWTCCMRLRPAIKEFLKCLDGPQHAHRDDGNEAQEEDLGWGGVNQPLFQLINPSIKAVGHGLCQVGVGADEQEAE